ncbi:hypothetical protein [Chitinophaga eiseniae]|uniref:hypothetical protein n=1 Tax=Chitinophaga eiseniae TaxID=634771 RepID=UPI001B3B26C2|nr:hypothetical protein [Chitinophaga eiseniae]
MKRSGITGQSYAFLGLFCFKEHNAAFNGHIKEVAKLAGIYEPIKFSHKKGNKDIEILTEVRMDNLPYLPPFFCPNEFLAGTPVVLMMKISGHKSLRDFYSIRITREEAG